MTPVPPSCEKNVGDSRGVFAQVSHRVPLTPAKKGSDSAHCVGCGEIFERPVGRGRPRLYCPVCVPPVGLVGMAEAARRWRELNPETIEGYNEARRVSHDPRPCSECGEDFTPGRSDRIVCSDRCRWARKRRLKREWEAASADREARLKQRSREGRWAAAGTGNGR